MTNWKQTRSNDNFPSFVEEQVSVDLDSIPEAFVVNLVIGMFVNTLDHFAVNGVIFPSSDFDELMFAIVFAFLSGEIVFVVIVRFTKIGSDVVSVDECFEMIVVT